MNIIRRIFHQCSEHLEYIEGSRFPKNGATGHGKVWRNYRCSVCGKLYTASGGNLLRIIHPMQTPVKVNI